MKTSARDEVAQETHAVGLLQVEHDAALATVHVGPQRPDAAHAVAQQSHAVAASGLLHLHHVGAEVGEQRAGPRPGHHLAGLDDGETLQRTCHGVAR